jgi:hypothetical protein
LKGASSWSDLASPGRQVGLDGLADNLGGIARQRRDPARRLFAGKLGKLVDRVGAHELVGVVERCSKHADRRRMLDCGEEPQRGKRPPQTSRHRDPDGQRE